MLNPWKKSYYQPRQHIKKQRHYFTNKGPPSQSYGFSRSDVLMWDLDYKESWALKNWCFWTVVLEKTLESLLDCKDIQPVNPRGNQSWIFIVRTDAEAETPNLWPYDAKNPTHWKRPWYWERLKVGGEGDYGGWDDCMVSLTWRTWVWASSRFGDGQGSLVCCSPWGCRVGYDWVTELNCVVVWTFFHFALLWDRIKNWPFPVLWLLLNLQMC